MLREILPGLFGGLVAMGLGYLAVRSQKSARMVDGWKQLRPGWMIHGVAAACAAFVLIISYFFIMGGSARHDAQEQNFYALVLLLAFGGAGVYIFWAAYLRRIAWLGNQIRLRSPFGSDAFYRFTDIIDIGSNIDGSECKLHFIDGRRLRVSVYFHGFQEFLAEMTSRLEARNASAAI